MFFYYWQGSNSTLGGLMAIDSQSTEKTKEIWQFPTWGRGLSSVWHRNFVIFQYHLLSSLFWLAFEPMIIFLTLGYGVGFLIGEVGGVPYNHFIFPALLANTILFVTFFESTFSSFHRIHTQQIYNLFLLSPLDPSEVALGEIFWAATKGFVASLGLVVFGLIQGFISSWMIFPVLLILFMWSWLVGAFGLFLVSFIKSTDGITYVHTGFVIPMSLLSGTYFPLQQIPEPLVKLTYLSPLTHVVSALRNLMNGEQTSIIFLNLGILFSLGFVLSNWVSSRLGRYLYQ